MEFILKFGGLNYYQIRINFALLHKGRKHTIISTFVENTCYIIYITVTERLSRSAIFKTEVYI